MRYNLGEIIGNWYNIPSIILQKIENYEDKIDE